MNLKDNGIFKFDYQFPLYNFFFPNQIGNVYRDGLDAVIANSNHNINSRALYFHIPFCETICTFCPFTRGAYRDNNDVDEYVNALIREIELKSSFNDYKKVPVRAIFFGGGTPSFLSSENMVKIGQAIKKHFLLSPDCEFSFEIEVKSLTAEKVLAMKDMGVTHPRFGLQTFDPEWRRLFNLTSTYEQINFAADILTKNFETVLFDIIYGMNGQDEEDIIRDLDKSICLGTSNIDIYPIDNVMTQPKLHKAIQDRGFPLTTATRKFAMNMLIDSYMRSKGLMPHNGHGYVRTNNVDQSVVTDEYSFKYHEHVYGYSDHDLHGFGVNAVSSIREHVITNTSSRKKYINSIKNGKIPSMISKHSKILDEMKPIILRLPYHGSVEKRKIKETPFYLQDKISELIEHKLVYEDNKGFYLTKIGWYWYTNIMFWLMPETDKDMMRGFITKQLSIPGKYIAKKELVYV